MSLVSEILTDTRKKKRTRKKMPDGRTITTTTIHERQNPYLEKYPILFIHDWCPSETKRAAVKQAVDARNATMAALRAKNQSPYSLVMRRRPKKDGRQRVKICSQRINVKWQTPEDGAWGFRFWTTKIPGIVLAHHVRDIRHLVSVFGEQGCGREVTLTRRNGRYHLVFPVTVTKRKPEPKLVVDGNDGIRVVALDPGVRTFQTAYDTRGRFFEYGSKDMARIVGLNKQIDRIQGRIAAYRGRRHINRRKNLRRYARRLRHRIENLVTDAHRRLANHLCRKYDHILIPVFRVSEMVRKGQRQIGRATTRSMYDWRHYAFRQRLKHKAEVMGCVVHEVSEHYTSKTCGRCGAIHAKLGSNKTFVCHSCSFSIPRDYNGARNVLIMNIETCVGPVRT